jgi:hypothetical protein
MHTKNLAIRITVGVVVVLLLLLPPFVTAIVWTKANLYITVIAIAATLAAAFYLPKLKWVFATIAAALIALPPYPNWLFWDESKGWFLTIGPNLRQLSIGLNVIFFVAVIALFFALFWAIGMRNKA